MDCSLAMGLPDTKIATVFLLLFLICFKCVEIIQISLYLNSIIMPLKMDSFPLAHFIEVL